MGGVSAVQGGQQAWQPVCSVTHSHSTGQSASLPRPLQPLPFIASQRRKTRISQVGRPSSGAECGLSCRAGGDSKLNYRRTRQARRAADRGGRRQLVDQALDDWPYYSRYIVETSLLL